MAYGCLADNALLWFDSSRALVVDGAAKRFTWPFTLAREDGRSEAYFVNAHMTS